MSAILFGSISTLADTSELQRDAFNRAFAEHGLDWRWEQAEYRELLTGNGGADRIAAYARDRGEDVDADAVHATKSKLFQEALAADPPPARPGVVDTVSAARAAGWQVALVTTTSRANLTALLDGVQGLGEEHFDLITDVDSVAEGKPDPAVYRFALDSLGVEAGDCVAIEDNVGGARSATDAGVACLALPNQNTAGHDFAGIDSVTVADAGDTLAFDRLAEIVGSH